MGSEEAFEALKQFLRPLKSSIGNAKLELGLDADRMKDLIRCLGSAYDEVIIIVDGLDECGENCSTAVELLHSINDDAASNIKILLTSRDIIEIREVLSDYEVVEIAAQSSELRLYVHAEIESRIRSRKLKLSNPALKQRIIERLVSEARAMYVHSYLRLSTSHEAQLMACRLNLHIASM